MYFYHELSTGGRPPLGLFCYWLHGNLVWLKSMDSPGNFYNIISALYIYIQIIMICLLIFAL